MMQFSRDNGYIQNPVLSTSIYWPHDTVEKMSSLRSYTVVTPHGKTHRTRVEIRLASAPPADAKTYMSKYTGSQTVHAFHTAVVSLYVFVRAHTVLKAIASC